MAGSIQMANLQNKRSARNSTPLDGRSGTADTVSMNIDESDDGSAEWTQTHVGHSNDDKVSPEVGATSPSPESPGLASAWPTRPASSSQQPIYTSGQSLVPAPTSQSTTAHARSFSIFTKRQKWFIVLISAWVGLFSPVSSSIFVPALPILVKEFGKSTEQINLTVTLYLIFQGITPSFWGALSDSIGRRPVYIVTMAIYIGACIGLALTPTSAYWLLLVLRMAQAAGGSAVIAIGAGCIADIATPEERGTFMGVFGGLSMIGPAFGPLLGGILTETLSWRWIFWILAIFAGAATSILALFMPETLRAVVGDGSVPAPTICALPKDVIARHRASKDPEYMEELRVKMAERPPRKRFDPFGSFRLLFQVDILAMLLYTSMSYSIFYCVLTTYSTYLQDYFGFNFIQIGLAYLPNGVGGMVCSLLNGRLMDWDFRRAKRKLGFKPNARVTDLEGFPVERVRMRFFPIVNTVFFAASIGYGWSMESRTSVAVPIVMTFFVGFCVQQAMGVTSVLLVDLFPGSGGSITAAFNLTRCLMAAALTALVQPIINAMGIGWAFVLLVGINICMAGLPVFVVLKGPAFRKRRTLMAKRKMSS